MKKKLKQVTGETLIEALVSMMIAVLAMGFISSSWMAATSINTRNREKDENYRQELSQIEEGSTSFENGRLRIDFQNSELTDVEVDIEVFGGAGSFANYKGGDGS